MITKQSIQRDHGLSNLISVAGDDARVPRRAVTVAPSHVEADRVIFSEYLYSSTLLPYQYASTSRTQIYRVRRRRRDVFTLQSPFDQRPRVGNLLLRP